MKNSVAGLPLESESFSHVQLFATAWTVACHAPLSMKSKSLLNKSQVIVSKY